jgi:GTPase SAR1 family protein
LVSTSQDRTLRVWERETGREIYVLEGHVATVRAASISGDGRLLASKSFDNSVRLWRLDILETIAIFSEGASANWAAGLAFHPQAPLLATLDEMDTAVRIWEFDTDLLLGCPSGMRSVRYTNAKVVLVGDTGVDKSGLGMVLTGQPFAPTESTHGRRVWTLESRDLEVGDGRTETRETLLWDLAGQPGYRVFHRQHLDEIAVALVLFDSRSETDPFAGVAYWARALDEATRGFPLVKFLVASRADRGGPPASAARIRETCVRYGFARFFETSAKRGDGVEELRRAIRAAIAWDQMPRVSAPRLFHDLKTFVVDEKKAGRVLQRRDELLQRYGSLRPTADELLQRHGSLGPTAEATEELLTTCLRRLEAAGLVKQLTFGDLVLLQPEMLDDYCAWLAQAARQEPDGLGFIADRKARAGEFAMDAGRMLQGKPEERLLITATVEDIIGRGIALRQPTEKGEMLVFPSELRTDMPDYPGGYLREAAFRFEGPVKAIFATLVVCLTHAPAFARERFFKNAAVFRSAGDEVCGCAVTYPVPGDDALGRLTVFFDGHAGRTTKLIFLRYVNRQLEEMAFAGSVQHERVYQCVCGYIIPHDAVERRRARKETTAICPDCGQQTRIDDTADQIAQTDPAVDEQMARSEEERQRQQRLAVLAERERCAEFHVFLCHNHRDKPHVRLLAAKLRHQGLLPWIDEGGISAGGQFAPELERVIHEAPAAAVLIGPHGLGNWQRQEYFALLQRYVEYREGKGQKRLALIPVLLPDAAAEPELPVFLRGFDWVDFRQEGGFDARKPMQRLIRAILGENQRE